jgi:hypothetical protein
MDARHSEWYSESLQLPNEGVRQSRHFSDADATFPHVEVSLEHRAPKRLAEP